MNGRYLKSENLALEQVSKNHSKRSVGYYELLQVVKRARSVPIFIQNAFITHLCSFIRASCVFHSSCTTILFPFHRDGTHRGTNYFLFLCNAVGGDIFSLYQMKLSIEIPVQRNRQILEIQLYIHTMYNPDLNCSNKFKLRSQIMSND